MAQCCELCRVPYLRLRHYYGVRLRKLALSFLALVPLFA